MSYESETTVGRPVRGWSTVTRAGDGLVVDAEAAWIGETALRAGVPLSELRPSGTSGLEDLFLQLTAHTQREGKAA